MLVMLLYVSFRWLHRVDSVGSVSNISFFCVYRLHPVRQWARRNVTFDWCGRTCVVRSKTVMPFIGVTRDGHEGSTLAERPGWHHPGWWHRDGSKNFFWGLILQWVLEKASLGRRIGCMWKLCLKCHHLLWTMTEKGCQFFSGKKRKKWVTPSVTIPGDTITSDATDAIHVAS